MSPAHQQFLQKLPNFSISAFSPYLPRPPSKYHPIPSFTSLPSPLNHQPLQKTESFN